MSKKTLFNVLRSFCVVLIAALILFGFISEHPAQSAEFKASYIKNLNDIINTHYQDYIDSSVMFKLPETVKADDDISVIVTLDVDSLLDLYDKTDKSKTFSEFVASDYKVQNTQLEINGQRQELLDKLDSLNVKYSTGESYCAVLSGFELIIKARDFEATCKSLGKGQNIIVGEEYLSLIHI